MCLSHKSRGSHIRRIIEPSFFHVFVRFGGLRTNHEKIDSTKSKFLPYIYGVSPSTLPDHTRVQQNLNQSGESGESRKSASHPHVPRLRLDLVTHIDPLDHAHPHYQHTPVLSSGSATH